ncbi:R3H domain-containing protein 4-like [Ostrea edulis]|uniref:R3H domain-containing protein 4-like n=1 Tax=Ostrea edulis TaxID=37623 RepID=UPI002095C4FC|nr:R3H domain-containing protein 4-like [Ostrea edulis]
MGVTKNKRNLFHFGYIEDELEQLENNLESEDEDSAAQSQRKLRRSRRSGYHGSSSSINAMGRKRMGANKARRVDNLRQLLHMVEKDDSVELDFDIFEPSMSAFTELFNEKEKMQVWNDFVNSSEEEQDRIISGRSVPETILEEEEVEEDFHMVGRITEDSRDNRKYHPSYSAEECFKRIDKKIKAHLKRRHLPLESLMKLEEGVIEFFKTWPDSVYIQHLTGGFERMLLHGVCQYLNLHSKSIENNGERHTQVENPYPGFDPPAILLSTYLKRSAS